MFSNRRKRTEQNKILYFSNQLSTVLSPKQGKIPELSEIELWDMCGNNIYNTNEGNVGIGMQVPLTALDVSGEVNSSSDYQLDYVSIVPPIGSILAYTVNSAPNGWLVCDGSAVSMTIYANLYAAIGGNFGRDLSKNTFNLPDYRGAFLRGTGTQGIYSGPALDASQNHATQTHTHTASQPAHSHQYSDAYFSSQQAGNAGLLGSGASEDSDNARVASNRTTETATPAITVNNSTTNVDSNETRPFNYGVYWIIKY